MDLWNQKPVWFIIYVLESMNRVKEKHNFVPKLSFLVIILSNWAIQVPNEHNLGPIDDLM